MIRICLLERASRESSVPKKKDGRRGVGLFSSLLVAIVAVSSQYSVQRSIFDFSERHIGYRRISRGRLGRIMIAG